MCLYSKQLKPMVATGDIRVWKVLAEDDLTPYTGQHYCHGRNVPQSLVCDIDRTVLPFCFGKQEVTVVYGGYLHAFRNAYVASAAAAAISGCRGDGKAYKVIAMRIPAGAQYWVGLIDDLAATELVWDEQAERAEDYQIPLFD